MALTKIEIATALGISEDALSQMTSTIELRRIESQLVQKHTELRDAETAAIQAVVEPIELKQRNREEILSTLRATFADAEQGKAVEIPDVAALLAAME